MHSGKDSIYADPIAELDAFKFDQKVVDVFPDMIRRSVPGYGAIISAIGLLAARFCQDDSRCYDLGCSLGAATWSMQQQINACNVRLVAVDNSQAMIDQLRSHLPAAKDSVTIEVCCADIRDIEIRQASVVVLNFTLQFLPLADRKKLLQKIFDGMLPGAILILSEKIAFTDPRQQALQMDMHHAFKKAQGYSDLEISQKRSALENVLLTETFNQHQRRLLDIGFSSAELWFQYFNFASMLALK